MEGEESGDSADRNWLRIGLVVCCLFAAVAASFLMPIFKTGGLAVAGALTVESWTADPAVTTSPTLTLALVALIVGLVLGSLALRDSISFSR